MSRCGAFTRQPNRIATGMEYTNEKFLVLGRGSQAAIAPRRATRGSASLTVMAAMSWRNKKNERVARPENAPGSFFVDHTCIDCDTCRWIAPETFSRVGDRSAVVAQPSDRAGRVAALKALVSCPTYSIHVTDRSPEELREAHEALPSPVPGLPNNPPPPPATAAPGSVDTPAPPPAATAAPGIYYTGWSSEKSFAGCAYLVVRPQGGNILVDSPRFNPVLARRIEAMGGVRHIFLTHRDDVGDHEAWAQRFGATRILHEKEVNVRQGTDKVEVKLSGEGPWVLDREGAVVPAPTPSADVSPDNTSPDVTLIFTPGHSHGHVCMYYKPYKALFSGDHLASSGGDVMGAPEDQLCIFTNFNWYSVPEQLKSVAKLLQYDWLHVLPAHGRRAHVPDATARLAAVHDLLAQHGADGAAAAAAAFGSASEVAPPVPAAASSGSSG